MISLKAILGYLAYAALAAVIFLYLLFPDQAVKAYMNLRLAAVDPDLSITAASIRPTLPPALKMTAVDLRRSGARLLHMDDARLMPNLMSLFKDDRQLRFTADAAGGTITGRAVLSGAAAQAKMQMEADLAGIRLERVDALKNLSRFSLTGVLRGHLMSSGGGRGAAETGSGLLTVAGLTVALKAPVFGIREVVTEQTDMDFTLGGQALRIRSLTFNGPMVEGRISGAIQLRQPFEQSRLNLSGNAKPQPELFARLQGTLPQDGVNLRTLGTRGLNFRIQGSIDKPELSMR